MFPTELIDGYRTFVGERLPRERARFETLAQKGQKPQVMIIGCCDSRVSPEVIFDAGPGELFVVRNVANLVPPYETNGDYHGTSAALEFAVQALRVQHIVVLGHEMCGGVKAYAADETEPLSPGDFIGKWVAMLKPSSERIGPRPASEPLAAYTERLAQASIATSLNNLRTFPCVKILEERGKLHLHGAYFGVATGQLSIRDPQTGTFSGVSDTLPERVSMMACN